MTNSMKKKIAPCLFLAILLTTANILSANNVKKKYHRAAELKSFEAKNDNGHSLLEWETAAKDKFIYFDIQKSTDGVNYVTVSQVNASAGKRADKHYIFVDNNTITGKTYYRILGVNASGTFEYSMLRPSVDVSRLSVSR